MEAPGFKSRQSAAEPYLHISKGTKWNMVSRSHLLSFSSVLYLCESYLHLSNYENQKCNCQFDVFSLTQCIYLLKATESIRLSNFSSIIHLCFYLPSIMSFPTFYHTTILDQTTLASSLHYFRLDFSKWKSDHVTPPCLKHCRVIKWS